MTKLSPSQHDSPPAVVAIVGSDSFLRGDALVSVLEPVRSEMGELGPMRFEGERATPAEVLDEVRTPSLLGGRRVAIVEDADDFISANRELMERYCSAPVSDSLLVFLCDSLPRNTRLYKIIEAHGQIVMCEAPKGVAFGTWISHRAFATYGKKIAAAAVQSLRRLLGDSPGWIDAELGKLAAYVGDRPEIAAVDVNELTDQRREEKVFGITDAMAEGDAATALCLWDQVLATDRAAPGRALAGLALKVRQMIEACDELEATGQVFASSRRMFMDAGELRRRLERISKRQLLEQQRDLLRADLAVKTGLSSLPLAIEQFIVKHTLEPTPKAGGQEGVMRSVSNSTRDGVCHAEQSETPPMSGSTEILRFAQNDSENKVRRTTGLVNLALLLSFSGCVVPPAEGKKVKASKQPESLTASAVEPSEKEEAKPQKQESLAAVEDFLSRTQEYRFPANREPENSMAPAAPRSIAPTVQPTGTAPTAALPPRDAAFANAQISLGDASAPATPQAIPAVESVSIRSPEPKNSVPSTPRKPQMTNGPLELTSNEKNESIELLVTSLKEELKTKQNVDTEWKLRMLLLSLGRDAEEAAIMDNAPSELKGILPAWGAASASIRSLLRNPVQGSESARERVDLLKEMLAAMGDPQVRSVALCRKVITYGSYEEMASEEFVSGRSIQTIVYAEIENLRSSNPGGVFETKLSTRLEVLTSDGKSMWQREEPEVVDRCRHPRRDFFVAQRITLPPTLPAGQYVLKVSVEDKTSGKIAESTAPFTIHSPISVAKGQ